MSIDLAIDPAIETTPNAVQDQSGNKSRLYISDSQTVVGQQTPTANASLTVFGESGRAAISTVRPDDNHRWHWEGMIGDKRIFTIRTTNGAFQIYVNDSNRISIDSTGNITLNVDGNLTINGLSQLSGSNVVDMVIDKSTGQVGHQ